MAEDDFLYGPDGKVRIPAALADGSLTEKVLVRREGQQVELVFINMDIEPSEGVIGEAVAKVWMSVGAFGVFIGNMAHAWREMQRELGEGR